MKEDIIEEDNPDEYEINAIKDFESKRKKMSVLTIGLRAFGFIKF
jgi:hypothetical protein